MIIEKFNLKAQEAIERACRLAVEKDHGVVTPWHLSYILLATNGGVGRQYLEQAAIDLARFGVMVDSQLFDQAKFDPNQQLKPMCCRCCHVEFGND
jgi:ATP-dependent Clp protease ATP-binding subunit ClpB